MDSPQLRLIHQGAEANLYLGTIQGWKAIVKRRVPKKYRNNMLDHRIRHERTVREATIISEARKAGVRTPTVLSLDLDDCAITISFISGTLARDELDRKGTRQQMGLFLEVGRQIGRLHQGGIVHGDFTTSNIIVSEKGAAFLIDFGLSNHSIEPEDRAVDLHLFRRSIETSHQAKAGECFKALVKGYTQELDEKEVEAVQWKVTEIARRGRYFAVR